MLEPRSTVEPSPMHATSAPDSRKLQYVVAWRVLEGSSSQTANRNRKICMEGPGRCQDHPGGDPAAHGVDRASTGKVGHWLIGLAGRT